MKTIVETIKIGTNVDITLESEFEVPRCEPACWDCRTLTNAKGVCGQPTALGTKACRALDATSILRTRLLL